MEESWAQKGPALKGTLLPEPAPGCAEGPGLRGFYLTKSNALNQAQRGAQVATHIYKTLSFLKLHAEWQPLSWRQRSRSRTRCQMRQYGNSFLASPPPAYTSKNHRRISDVLQHWTKQSLILRTKEKKKGSV